MSSSRLALVGADQQVLVVLQAHLEQTLGLPAFNHSFESIRNHLNPKSNGILLIAVASAADCLPVVRLVQEIRLNQWPLRIVLIESEAAAQEKGLSFLEAHGAGRLGCPEPATPLTSFLK